MAGKYEVTHESKKAHGEDVFRIRALRAIPNRNVKKGDMGGFVLSDSNLSQEGDCWIADEAVVTDKATVQDNAYVYGQAEVSDTAVIKNDAVIGENAQIDGTSIVSKRAVVGGSSHINYARVTTDAKVFGSPFIYDSTIGGNTLVNGIDIGILESKTTGVVEILDGAYLERTNVIGTNISIRDEAKLTDVTIGETKKMKDVIISDKVEINNTEIYGSTVLITGQAVLEDGVAIYGDTVSITDLVHLKGMIKIGHGVNLVESVSVINTTKKPVQFNYETVRGDIALMV